MRQLNMVSQPNGSIYCMAHCIAALLDRPVNAVIDEIGDRYLDVAETDCSAADALVINYILSHGMAFLTVDDFKAAGYYMVSVPSLNRTYSRHAIIVRVIHVPTADKNKPLSSIVVYDSHRDNPGRFHYGSVIDHANDPFKCHSFNHNRAMIIGYMSEDTFNAGPTSL